MPLISIGAELKRARAGKYALPLFDAEDSLSADGMFAALEACRAPAMIAIYTALLDRPGGRALAAYLRARAEDAPVPVSIMLDHGSSFEACIKALKFGLTDVMFDGSRLPIEENIAITRHVVRAAHACGACVEAELGHVGMGKDYQEFGAMRKGFTQPDDVERFVAETGVDFLAVAIGTAHGIYQGEPQLDLELLDEIAARVEIPLVMHGGSGLAKEQFQAAIGRGIAKVNIATDLFISTAKRLVEVGQGQPSYFDFNRASVETFKARCSYYLDIFGASGKAG